MSATKKLLIRARATARRLISLSGSVLARTALLGFAIVIGMLSSWFAVHRGLPFNTEKSGAWVVWRYAGQATSEPYTRARFAMSGGLPISGDRIIRLEARFDDSGRRLHSSCVYEISGTSFEAQWWSLAVFDASGRLIPNAAQRYGLNSATAAIGADGTFRIRLSRDAHSGNWLPTGAAGRMVVILEVQEPEAAGADGERDLGDLSPPSIKRISC